MYSKLVLLVCDIHSVCLIKKLIAVVPLAYSVKSCKTIIGISKVNLPGVSDCECITIISGSIV